MGRNASSPFVHVTPLSVGVRIRCAYGNGPNRCPERARHLVHDKRGCLHVCSEHAHWRTRTSLIVGHSADCPQK
jgi:hypothetical protein